MRRIAKIALCISFLWFFMVSENPDLSAFVPPFVLFAISGLYIEWDNLMKRR